jgi:catechol 2,3-dioxygenase-like lactoylglutathione lyase family enzyme
VTLPDAVAFRPPFPGWQKKRCVLPCPDRSQEGRMQFKIRGITLFTSEMAKMTAFYRDVIGLKLIEDKPGWKQFDAGGCVLALHKGKSAVGTRPPKIGFHADDVAAAKALLEARGARLGRIHMAEDVTFCDGQDPDGNSFSLTSRRLLSA